MLPDIASIKDQIRAQLILQLQMYVRLKDPVLRQIKSFVQHEGQQHRYDRVKADPLQEGYHAMQEELQIRMDEVPDLIGEKLANKMRSIGDRIVEQQARMFFQKVGESCEEVGNVVKAAGTPTAVQLLEMMDKVEMQFDAGGNPTSSFVLHPSAVPAFKEVAEQIENDPQLKARSDAIRQRQFEQWTVRESNRKLAD